MLSSGGGFIRSKFSLDERDRHIYEALQENPDATQQEISGITGLSQPSIGSRVKKMRALRVIDHTYGIDIKNIGFYLFKIEVKSTDPKNLIKNFRDCPFFLNGLIFTSEMNVTLIFICEQLNFLEAIVENHIKDRPDVYDIDAGIIDTTERNMYVPVKIVDINHSRNPSCGAPCDRCRFWLNGLCPGCPVTEYIEKTRQLFLLVD